MIGAPIGGWERGGVTHGEIEDSTRVGNLDF
jgi:hypothetical protein